MGFIELLPTIPRCFSLFQHQETSASACSNLFWCSNNSIAFLRVYPDQLFAGTIILSIVIVELTLLSEDMEDEAYEISSELYEEYDYTCSSKPSVNPDNVVSRFSFKLPQYGIRDKEGDFIVSRKTNQEDEYLEVEHSFSTNLAMVGLQIWRGSLLLADWLLHNGNSFTKDEYILELASGVGLTAIVASMFAPVLSTDIDRGDIFKLIKGNVSRNELLNKYSVDVMELDFMAENLPEEIVSKLAKVKTVIAADVVYDDHLTEAFIRTLQKILDIPPKRRILVALEKRYVFTISDCDTCAPCYDVFLDKMQLLSNVDIEEIKTDFPKYFLYDRSKELTLWSIRSK